MALTLAAETRWKKSTLSRKVFDSAIPIISIESMTVYFFLKKSTTKENNRQFPIKVMDVTILTTFQKFEMEQKGSSFCQLLYTTNI